MFYFLISIIHLYYRPRRDTVYHWFTFFVKRIKERLKRVLLWTWNNFVLHRVTSSTPFMFKRQALSAKILFIWKEIKRKKSIREQQCMCYFYTDRISSLSNDLNVRKWRVQISFFTKKCHFMFGFKTERNENKEKTTHADTCYLLALKK